MMMEEGALRLLLKEARDAAGPEEIDVCDPRMARFTVGGEVVEFELPNPWIASVASADGLADFVNNHGAKDADLSEDGPSRRGSVVMVGPNEAVAYLDADHRIDKAVMPMRLTNTAKAVKSIGVDGKAFHTSRELVTFMRFALGLDDSKIAPFRRIEWSSQGNAHSAANAGDDSLGRDVQARARGLDADLPQSVALTFDLFDKHLGATEVSLEIQLDVRANEETIYLRLLPGAWERAAWSATESLADTVRGNLDEDTRCQVYVSATP